MAVSNTVDPNFQQANLQQIEAAIAPIIEPGGQGMSRLYLTPTNPYTPGVGDLHGSPPGRNHDHYQQILLDAPVDGYVPTDSGAYIARTQPGSSVNLRNWGFHTYEANPKFLAALEASGGQGGGVAFFVNQSAQSLAHVRAISGSNNHGSSSTQSGSQSNRETLTPSPTETTTRTEGTKREHTATLAYRGLGEYQNFPVPKSDASLLMGLVRNYLLFSGVIPTTPNDPTAEVLVYITVDIFGTVRSRFDALLYNNETVKAETSFEIAAFDRDGKRILSPQVSNREAQYREHYLLWAGPLTTREQVYQGQGLLVDFTDVDGSKPRYNPEKPVVREHLGGKN